MFSLVSFKIKLFQNILHIEFQYRIIKKANFIFSNAGFLNIVVVATVVTLCNNQRH